MTTNAEPRLQVVGGGKMGLALVQGMIAAGWASPEELLVVEVNDEQRSVIEAELGVSVAPAPARGCDTLLAVKPYLVVPVAESLDAPSRIMSVAAGITTAAMEAVLPSGTPVVRVMPNTPALVGAGAAAAAPGTNASDDDMAWALELLRSVGEAVAVTEAQLDAVTGLSGSGPAYIFMIAEAMTDAGVTAGLTRADAARLATQTVYGAGKMLVETGQSPAELRAGVTTPAGTTAAGLAVLEQAAVRSALIEAVAAATARSKELGAS